MHAALFHRPKINSSMLASSIEGYRSRICKTVGEISSKEKSDDKGQKREKEERLK